jgi:hypothetical protein
LVVQSKSGLMVAAGMPRGVIDKISRDTTRVAQDDLRQRFVDVGAVAIGNLLGQFSFGMEGTRSAGNDGKIYGDPPTESISNPATLTTSGSERGILLAQTFPCRPYLIRWNGCTLPHGQAD